MGHKILLLQNMKTIRDMAPDLAPDLLKICDDDRFEFIQPESEAFISRDEIIAFARQHVPGVSGIINNELSWCLPTECLDLARPTLKVLATPTAGYDHLPVQYLKEHGIRLGTSNQGIVEATAQSAFILCLWAMRNFKEAELAVTTGRWATMTPTIPLWVGLGLQGKTIGVLGMGRIGQLLIPLATPWGVERFLYTTSRPGQPIRTDYYKHVANATIPIEVAQNQDDLIRNADVLFLSCQLDASTRHMVDKDFLSKMKKTAILVNIGRGGLLDTMALLQALKNEQIYAAGLDVIEHEYSPNVVQFKELIDHPRCVVLPHLGSAIGTNRLKAFSIAVENACLGAIGEQMPNEVML